MRIKWIEAIVGSTIFILGILAVPYGAEQMQGNDVTKIGFYGILLLLISKEISYALKAVLRSIHPSKKVEK